MTGIIRVSCPSCGKGHTAPAVASGKTSKCRQCGSEIVFPGSPAPAYDRPFQLDVDSKNPADREASGSPKAGSPLDLWRVAFVVAVLGLLSINPLIQFRSQWSARSDADRMREIHRRIGSLKHEYDSGKEQWSSSQALLEMKSNREKMIAFKDEEWERYRKLKSTFQGSYYRMPEAASNLAEQTGLQSEYRDALWRHPDWQVASETFPSVSEP